MPEIPTAASEVATDRAQLEMVVASLPRCRDSKSRFGNPKRALPTLELAEAVASWTTDRMIVYPCQAGDHFHVAQAVDVHTQLYSRRKWNKLMGLARERAGLRGRQRVYGVRTASGRWLYWAHPAVFRDQERTSPPASRR